MAVFCSVVFCVHLGEHRTIIHAEALFFCYSPEIELLFAIKYFCKFFIRIDLSRCEKCMVRSFVYGWLFTRFVCTACIVCSVQRSVIHNFFFVYLYSEINVEYDGCECTHRLTQTPADSPTKKFVRSKKNHLYNLMGHITTRIDLKNTSRFLDVDRCSPLVTIDRRQCRGITSHFQSHLNGIHLTNDTVRGMAHGINGDVLLLIRLFRCFLLRSMVVEVLLCLLSSFFAVNFSLSFR